MSSFVEFPLVLTPVLERGSVESSVAYQRSAKKSIFAGGGRSSVTLTRKLESTQSVKSAPPSTVAESDACLVHGALRLCAKLALTSLLILEIVPFLALAVFWIVCEPEIVCEPQPYLSELEVYFPFLGRCGRSCQPHVFKSALAAFFGIGH